MGVVMEEGANVSTGTAQHHCNTGPALALPGQVTTVKSDCLASASKPNK